MLLHTLLCYCYYILCEFHLQKIIMSIYADTITEISHFNLECKRMQE